MSRNEKDKLGSVERQASPPDRRSTANNTKSHLVRLRDQTLNNVVRLIDMLQRAMTQSVGKTIIFFFGDVMVCLVEKL